MLTHLKQALAWRARYWRKIIILASAGLKRKMLRTTTFVGITGSVGKTTTKDLVVAVLSKKGKTQGNRKGLNYLEDIGSAILFLPNACRYAVFEVATSGPGTIDKRIDLVRPSIAVMTVVGRDHIKRFGSMGAIAAEKGKLISALPADGVAVLNIDDPLVRAVGEKAAARCVWFGSSPQADLRLLSASSGFPQSLTLKVEHQGESYTVNTSLHGVHLATSVLAALGVGLAAGMRIDECIVAIKEPMTTPGRMQVVECADGVTFIRDDFKSPHWSLPVIYDYLIDARAGRKVAVIGTLSDYSLSASKLYPKVARRALEVADLVVFVGPHALRALKAKTEASQHKLFGFTEIKKAHEFLRSELRSGDLVLLKGTNRVDHLVRLVLAREQPVSCWRSDCGWNFFCDDCIYLDRPVHMVEDAFFPVVSTFHGSDGELGNIKGFAGLSENADGVIKDIWLVIGLGNPGDEYVGTPHNMGFEVLDYVAKNLILEWVEGVDGMMARAEISTHQVILFKPSVAINRAGFAVEKFRGKLNIPIDRVVVIHDDADLEMPDVRLKYKGSDGGHRGVRSLISALRNDGFMPRIRVGIRTPGGTESLAKSVVLKRFSSEDFSEVQKSVANAGVLLLEFLGANAEIRNKLVESMRSAGK
ncbi:aminoacyl-tRNA hydrolase [Ectothiorhodospira shaposhnikovii]|uniref:aminoacyl-tRNA hydrolase n=1 Tax=Ectothiorhodospira shaposhnikovii TaxID=1054 RepID=UPI0019076705|nr:aminoacyl-tRNA hydrolase [Ectothiorhodospira shaposhnikovii]